jgi:DNA-binding transcriptional MerR regulator
MGEQLSIGEFARRSWLSPKALRLYESEGLLVPERESNGYRAYDTDQLRDARVVRLLRRLDMPVQQVRAVLDARPQDQAELVDAYWRSVESRVIQQRSLVAHALETLSGR